ncbi:hypothetical protein [Herbidospora daliensis]|uniref:hypothetical protein n=1 Tax=Herbidospora daliensis TaxID=295585 RepID=UPI000780A499|nr:hypothetical protein [Herbidospora daliensis]
MESAKVVAAAAVAVAATTVVVVGVVLTSGSSGGSPEEAAPIYAVGPMREAAVPTQEVAVPAEEVTVPTEEVARPLRTVVAPGESTSPPPPVPTVAPTFDPAKPPTVSIWGNSELRAVDLMFGGFEPGEVVVVTTGGREAAQTEMDELGGARFRGFHYHLTLPDGHHEFTATGQRSGRSATFGMDV